MNYLLPIALLIGAWTLLRNLGNERERRLRYLELMLEREAEDERREKRRTP